MPFIEEKEYEFICSHPRVLYIDSFEQYHKKSGSPNYILHIHINGGEVRRTEGFKMSEALQKAEEIVSKIPKQITRE